MSDRNIAQLRVGFERMEGAQACRNLMGRASYYGSASRCCDMTGLWSHREDSVLWLDCGLYRGYEKIRSYYLTVVKDRSLPDRTEELKGTMIMHALDTQVLCVANDGQTARGCWISPGHETYVVNGRPQPKWCWQKYQADFIKEDGVWYIWKMHIMPLFCTPYNTCWVDCSQEEVPTAEGAEPVPRATYSYDPDAVYPADEPWIPIPYETYTDLPDIYV